MDKTETKIGTEWTMYVWRRAESQELVLHDCRCDLDNPEPLHRDEINADTWRCVGTPKPTVTLEVVAHEALVEFRKWERHAK